VVASTFKAIVDKVAQPALVRADIRLNQRVVGISNIPSSPPTVSVVTADGEENQFDALVVTTPLGWLKKHAKEVFKPVLPSNILHAISEISVGHLEKVYIHFPRAFWRSEGGSASQENDNGVVEDPHPGYTNWITPSYATDTNPNRWPQEAYDLASFAAPNAHPTLLWYIYGDGSAHITSKIHNRPPSEQDTFLKTFFEPYYSRLPGYDPTDSTCQPKAFLATTWQHDEFAGNGSYCNFQVGIEDADECLESIRTGCPERAIWFAGEHAAPEEEMGTVAGAYLSGERAANNLLEYFKM
jgi:monoamine oxidase